MRPRLLDLFSGAGGCSMGYHRAGFDVVGVDIKPQKNYPFEFHQADALTFPLDGFDAIHASPPCQFASALRHLWPDRDYENLIPATRDRLLGAGVPYVIENVTQARRFLREPLRLCGSGFGLDLHRHRYFECGGFHAMSPGCSHGWQGKRFSANRSDRRRGGGLSTVVVVAGHDTRSSVVSVHGLSGNSPDGGVALWRRVMGIEWMTQAELAQAIPPVYTEHIGGYLLAAVRAREAA